jgi:hypothetical protein
MTSAPQTLVAFQAKCTQRLGTVNLGISGDAPHIRTGGYHIGAASLRAAGMGDDYSLQYPADRNATHDWACAADLGGTPTQLMLLGNRIVHALMNKDPRVYGRIRAVNSPFDSITIDRRYDLEDPNNTSDDNCQASDDRGHIHIEIYRTLILNPQVIDDLFAVLAGDAQEEAMTLSAADLKQIEGLIDTRTDASDKGIVRREQLILDTQAQLGNAIKTLTSRIDQLLAAPSKGA